MELPEEQHILREIARGNIKAFEQLFFDYQPRLVYFLVGLTHDKDVYKRQVYVVQSALVHVIYIYSIFKD